MRPKAFPGLAAAFAVLSPSLAAAEVPPGRLQLDATVGVISPGQMTPQEIFPTYTGFGPIVRLDFTATVAPPVELGSYLSFSSHPVTSITGSTGYDHTGSAQVFSGGGVLLWRVALTPSMALRAGVLVGVNYDRAYLSHTAGGGEAVPGYGLQVGALVDLRFAVAPPLALLVQLGFISQPVGGATFPSDTDRPGEHEGFAFQPMPFLTVGPEIFLGP